MSNLARYILASWVLASLLLPVPRKAFAACDETCDPDPQCPINKGAGAGLVLNVSQESIERGCCCDVSVKTGQEAANLLGVSAWGYDPYDTGAYQYREQNPFTCECVLKTRPPVQIGDNQTQITWTGSVDFSTPGDYTLTATITNNVDLFPCHVTGDVAVSKNVAVTIKEVKYDPTPPEYVTSTTVNYNWPYYVGCDGTVVTQRYTGAYTRWEGWEAVGDTMSGPCGLSASAGSGHTSTVGASVVVGGNLYGPIEASLGWSISTGTSWTTSGECPGRSCQLSMIRYYQKYVHVTGSYTFTSYNCNGIQIGPPYTGDLHSKYYLRRFHYLCWYACRMIYLENAKPPNNYGGCPTF